MHATPVRRFALGAVLAAALFAGPVLAASPPGSLTLVAPVAGAAVGGDSMTVEWQPAYGSVVRWNSKVDVYLSADGGPWSKVALGIPVRTRVAQVETSGRPDAEYAVRVTVLGTSVSATVTDVALDHTAPEIQITRPSTSMVVVDDESSDAAIVAGRATLEAAASDALSGVADVVWHLDDTEIGHGTSYTHDFHEQWGEHMLRATAVDRAGNAASVSMSIVAVPGPSTATDHQPPLPNPEDQVPPVPDPEDQVPPVPPVPDPEDQVPPVPPAPNPEDQVPPVPPAPNPEDQIPPVPPAPNPEDQIPLAPNPGDQGVPPGFDS